MLQRVFVKLVPLTVVVLDGALHGRESRDAVGGSRARTARLLARALHSTRRRSSCLETRPGKGWGGVRCLDDAWGASVARSR
ncbi:hypothetical protein BDY17DRAFT_294051 [Neohortaea acidophila]|uniref:Secreted protein n=1 Tax=Neohortaea acidophila TaxID=245834 RepID=A0A6A6Q1W0_9PEZI|nr:uncharacterized protein BDY17DRAFT_294051 [Neohortaea acidophila]KAF2485663.1 hypothetical protein BDY17DRAFT_294051 [Neohortaea acidophila]